MTYTVQLLYPNQGEIPRTKQLEGTFDSVRDAWEAGRVEVLACQLRSVEAGYQIHDASGQLVEVTAGEAESAAPMESRR